MLNRKLRAIFFMKNTILFDLDGTVLPMDFDMFMKLYFYNMGEHFKSVIESDKIFKYIMEATSVMIQTNNGDTNEKTFMNHFASLIDGSIDEYTHVPIQGGTIIVLILFSKTSSLTK